MNLRKDVQTIMKEDEWENRDENIMTSLNLNRIIIIVLDREERGLSNI
jgi:hypothetical protein